MSFGENLINLRRQKGWSQDDLANNLNISRQAISKWENNTSKPDVDNIEKISKIFSVKIDELLNNELPNDKAVALDVKKEEKKEKTITIVKLMIIAVIILYAISVIYKFASLLVIVNGLQKYANLNNYHYVITTYDENGLAEKEECWFKDGVSKTENILYENNIPAETVSTCVNYREKNGYIYNGKDNVDINYEEYESFHKNYDDGFQLYSRLPDDIKNLGIFKILEEALCNYKMTFNFIDERIFINMNNSFLILDKNSLLPLTQYNYDNKDEKTFIYSYKYEINTIDDLEI